MVTKNISACICGCGQDTRPDHGSVYMRPECAAKIRATYTAEAGIPDEDLSTYQVGMQFARIVGGNLSARVAAMAKTVTDHAGREREGADAFLFGVATVTQERAA
jgi:hypothetical protein